MKITYDTATAQELGLNISVVLAYLKAKPIGTVDEWASDLCLSTNRVTERLRDLEARGYIKRVYNPGKRNAGRLQIVGVQILK